MRRFLSCSSGRFLVFLSVVLIPLTAEAQPTLRVFPDEYVIEPADSLRSSASALGAVMTSRGVSMLRRIADGVHLVGPSQRRLRAAARAAVPVNPADTFCKDLVRRRLARSCTPNFEIRTSALPNDPRFNELWGFADADAGVDTPRAWDVSTGSDNVVVAVVDTGIDYNHPDLAGNMWVNPGETPANGIDDDRNGYIDDVHGMSAVDGSGDPGDDNGHGTHVAGTIGARGNNGNGVAGINWRVKLMACKFLNASGSGSLSGAIEAINYVVTMKRRGVNVQVANNSWGGGAFSQSLYNAISAARDAGILFVAAAGNESNNNDASPSYPASYQLSNVIAVAAINRDSNLASFSNYGAQNVDIAAPGSSILSTFPGSGYRSLSGTSMAAPHVSGALALLFAAQPGLTPDQALTRLYNSGVSLPSLAGVVRTGRLLNVGRLLAGDQDPISGPAPAPTPACSYQAEQIPFAPDYSADGQPVMLQADELSFQEVALPFSFPFFEQSVTSVVISPNGVLYLNGAPQAMDYENGPQAPTQSIAALQTDLYAGADPHGVRIAFDGSHLTVYWLAKYYGRSDLGDVAVRTSLYSDGRIETFVSIPDAQTAQLVQAAATMGVAGTAADTPLTFAYNNSTIADGAAVRYTRQCTQSPGEAPPSAQVTQLSLKGINRNGESVTRALPGRPLNVELGGQGSGSVSLRVALDGAECEIPAAIEMNEGYASLMSILPRSLRRYRSIEFRASNAVKARLKVKRSAEIRRKAHVSRREFRQDCTAIVNNLTQ